MYYKIKACTIKVLGLGLWLILEAGRITLSRRSLFFLFSCLTQSTCHAVSHEVSLCALSFSFAASCLFLNLEKLLVVI